MAKIIVTHISPDLDSIAAIWLLKKLHPEFAAASIAFVPAGETYNNLPVDSNPDIVHIDTGLGKFDHHQTDAFTCGTKLVYEWLVSEGYIKDDEALARMVEIISQLDHGFDNYQWPEPANDRYEFLLPNILTGWKVLYPQQEEKHLEWAIRALDAVCQVLQLKARAEKEIVAGLKFPTRWGEGVAVYTANDSVLDLGIKRGYALVVLKEPSAGFVRITGSSTHGVDLTAAFEALCQKDTQASWFLHASKVLLRNGSSRNPKMRPTRLGIEEIVEILKKA